NGCPVPPQLPRFVRTKWCPCPQLLRISIVAAPAGAYVCRRSFREGVAWSRGASLVLGESIVSARARRLVVLSVSLLATVVAELVPSSPLAAPAVAASTPSADVVSRPDSVSAALAARVTGHRVEDLSQ